MKIFRFLAVALLIPTFALAQSAPTAGGAISAGPISGVSGSSSSGIKSSSPSGGIGYTTGAGGTVTQTTSRATGVTLNTVTGVITGNNTSLAISTSVTFTVTDSSVAATDVPLIVMASGGPTTTFIYVSAVAAGSFNITEWNTSTTVADTTTPVINFVVIKGSSS